MAIQLKETTLKNLKGQTDIYVSLAEEFGLNDIASIRRWLRLNKPNGPLTTKAALTIIAEGTGIPADLLTEESNNENYSRGVEDSEPACSRPHS